jgi:hypothetical protein
MPWQVELFGETFRELDCSPGLAEKLEDTTGYRWDALAVVLTGDRREAKAARHTAAALLAEKLGLTETDALAKVDSVTIGELFAGVTDYDDDLPTVMEDGFPPSADEPSTPG